MVNEASIVVVTFASVCAKLEFSFWAYAVVDSSKSDALGGTLSSGVGCLVISLIQSGLERSTVLDLLELVSSSGWLARSSLEPLS